MRCASCGAMFKPVKSSQTKCERCEKREREQRAAAKHSGGPGQKPTATAPQPVRISGPAASLLGASPPASPGAAQEPPPEPTTYGMAAWRDEERREREQRERERREREQRQRMERESIEREQARERPAHGHSDSHHPQPQGARPQGKPRPPRAERPPQPPKPPRAVPPRIELTDDLRATIEARYLELAQPVEFDGIRTQIATELSVPKALVKKAVADLRKRMALPSWWELQAYTGPEVELERIRAAYVPLLPVPEVGVHKTLSERLGMDPRTVYQGIRRIRAEMRLPQYNPPELHEGRPGASEATPAPAPMDATTPGAQS